MTTLVTIPDNYPVTPAPWSKLECPRQTFLFAPGWNEFADRYGHAETYVGATKRQYRVDFDGVNDVITFAGAEIQSPVAPWAVTVGFKLHSLTGPAFLCGQGDLIAPNIGWGLYISSVDSFVYAYSSHDGSNLGFSAAPLATATPVTVGQFHTITMAYGAGASFITMDGLIDSFGGVSNPAIFGATDFRIGSSADPTWFVDGEIYFVDIQQPFTIATFPELQIEALAHLTPNPSREMPQ